MANWIYGTIFIKGPAQNIINFLNNGLQDEGEEENSHQFFLNENNEIDIVGDNEETNQMYIANSPRHFIEVDLYEICPDEGDVQEAQFSYQIAWGIDPETVKFISDFGLHVSIYGDEWGACFAQYIVYENGKLLNNSMRNLGRSDYTSEFADDMEDDPEEERKRILASLEDESKVF